MADAVHFLCDVLAIAALLSLEACSTWASTGSVHRGRCSHVGVRPSARPGEYALTVHVTTDTGCNP